MNILLLAPQPFYQERGTPIAVKLLVEILCGAGNRVDLVTYYEGDDITIAGLQIFRITHLPFIKNIPIGFSWQKLVCDLILIKKMMNLLKKNSYQIVHANEETIFPSVLLKHFCKFRLIYDMDSSLADQLIEKYFFLRLFKKLLYKTEGWALRKSDFVITVCRNLANKAKRYLPENQICVLHDIPIKLGNNVHEAENLRELLNIRSCLALYVGNLEHYQGIDLMLEGMASIQTNYQCNLVIIGGKKAHIEKYALTSKNLGLTNRVHLIGPRPLSSLADYLAQADILVSCRTKGLNTPMKIYSYLASGKPVFATKIESHTQVLDSSCAMLVDPTSQAIAKGLTRLIKDPDLCHKLGLAGKNLVQKKYSSQQYKRKLLNFYDRINQDA